MWELKKLFYCELILDNVEMLQQQLHSLIDQGEDLTSYEAIMLSEKIDELINICQELNCYR